MSAGSGIPSPPATHHQSTPSTPHPQLPLPLCDPPTSSARGRSCAGPFQSPPPRWAPGSAHRAGCFDRDRLSARRRWGAGRRSLKRPRPPLPLRRRAASVNLLPPQASAEQWRPDASTPAGNAPRTRDMRWENCSMACTASRSRCIWESQSSARIWAGTPWNTVRPHCRSMTSSLEFSGAHSSTSPVRKSRASCPRRWRKARAMPVPGPDGLPGPSAPAHAPLRHASHATTLQN